jgi:hypothetical protein
MGAMTSLNLASNWICRTGNVDGIKAISSALKVLAIILVPFHLYLTSRSTAGVCYYPQDMGALLLLNLASNNICAEGTKLLAAALKGNQIMTKLNISSNVMTFGGTFWGDMSGIIPLADVISDMRAMTSLHVGQNNIPEKEMKEIIVDAMNKESMKMLCEVPIKDKTLTELDVSGLSLGSEGALVVAEYLRDNGAMTSINLANNNIGAIVMSDGWKYDQTTNEYWKNVDGTEQVSKYLPECCGPLGVIAVANAIKDMRALSVANVMGNSIGKEQLAKLQEITCSKPNLVSLCGIADDATEADLSGHGMDADDAAILASELLDKGALLTLILSKNGIIQREVGTVLAGMLKANTVLTTLDISDCADYTAGPDGAGFAQELAVGIKDNWALTKLDISNNIQQGEALQRIADLCNTKGVELDNHKRESDWDY